MTFCGNGTCEITMQQRWFASDSMGKRPRRPEWHSTRHHIYCLRDCLVCIVICGGLVATHCNRVLVTVFLVLWAEGGCRVHLRFLLGFSWSEDKIKQMNANRAWRSLVPFKQTSSVQYGFFAADC